jgi:tRNA threonylcarbamoyladenosine biosynthesis protein TsaB
LARGHAERLLPVLCRVMAAAGWRWADLGLVAATLGPGNFTGLRAGIAAARALSLALSCPALGVGTLEALAQAAAPAAAAEGRPILAILDARREEVYWQRFAPDLTPLSAPALAARATLAALWREPAILVGDRVAAVAAVPDAGHATVEAAPHARYVAETAWRRLAAGALAERGFALHPLYIRAPDARPSAGRPLVAAAS